jgi:hypothetical protein
MPQMLVIDIQLSPNPCCKGEYYGKNGIFTLSNNEGIIMHAWEATQNVKYQIYQNDKKCSFICF